MQSGIGNSSRLQAKRARLEAVARKRRVIFNDDTYEFCHEGSDTPEGFLGPRLAPLAGTSVDTICWSVLATGLDTPSYDTKVQPLRGDANDPHARWLRDAAYHVNLKALLGAGHCPLRIVTDFAHKNGMESFASMRMNDCHDSFVKRGQTVWKMQHPQWKVDSSQGVLPHLELYVTAWDFSHEEVRQRKY